MGTDEDLDDLLDAQEEIYRKIAETGTIEEVAAALALYVDDQAGRGPSIHTARLIARRARALVPV